MPFSRRADSIAGSLALEGEDMLLCSRSSEPPLPMSEAAQLVQSDRESVIERIERPTREVFERDYEAHSKPVILTGVTDDWPALEKWGPDYFKQVAGEQEVRVPY